MSTHESAQADFAIIAAVCTLPIDFPPRFGGERCRSRRRRQRGAMLTARRRRTDQGPVGLATLCFTVYEVLVLFDTVIDTFGGSRFCPSLPCGHLSPQMRGETICGDRSCLSALRASRLANAGREYQSFGTLLKLRKFTHLCRIDRFRSPACADGVAPMDVHRRICTDGS